MSMYALKRDMDKLVDNADKAIDDLKVVARNLLSIQDMTVYRTYKLVQRLRLSKLKSSLKSVTRSTNSYFPKLFEKYNKDGDDIKRDLSTLESDIDRLINDLYDYYQIVIGGGGAGGWLFALDYAMLKMRISDYAYDIYDFIRDLEKFIDATDDCNDVLEVGKRR